MHKVILNIAGMSCSGCSSGLEKYLNKQEGIVKANVNLVLAQALIEYDDSIALKDLECFIKEAGFESLGVYKEEYNEKKYEQEKRILILFFIFSLIIMYVAMAHMFPIVEISYLNKDNYPSVYAIFLFILTLPFLWYGFDIFKSGIKTLTHKMPNMDTLVSLGVFANFLYSFFCMIMIILGYSNYVNHLYFESCAMIIFFIKLGRYIDGRSKEKTKDAIKELVQITPSKAIIKEHNQEVEVTIDEVKKGNILVVRAGEKIAVDGTVLSGSAYLDEAFITGEAHPIKKEKGARVLAGSLNLDGYLEYKAEKIGKQSMISEIVRLVVDASNTKAPIARVADRVSLYFVPSIIMIAIVSFLTYLFLSYSFSYALNIFVTVLVVACPCALGLATPLAIVISEGLCACNGILVKTSEVLENACKVDTIVFDKTGTLTYGNLRICQIFNYSQYTDDELIVKVASLENKSTHPIAKAFISYITDKRNQLLKVTKFKNMPGLGISGVVNYQQMYVGNSKIVQFLNIENDKAGDEKQLVLDGNSICYVVEDDHIIALIGVKDIVRDNAREVVAELKRYGCHVIMLTGDHDEVAKIIAKNIGINQVYANALPKEKTEIIKKLVKERHNVMMVGDGINDAPSLATANIGVSIHSGTDIALNSANVILTNDNLEGISTLIQISKKTIRNIKQNLFWAFFYNICMIPIAIGVFESFHIVMNPMIASVAMTFSSLTVVFNALRLKRLKK